MKPISQGEIRKNRSLAALRACSGKQVSSGPILYPTVDPYYRCLRKAGLSGEKWYNKGQAELRLR
jgi:hypothetical protein